MSRAERVEEHMGGGILCNGATGNMQNTIAKNQSDSALGVS